MLLGRSEKENPFSIKADSGGVGLTLSNGSVNDLERGRFGEVGQIQVARLRGLEEQGLAEEIGNGFYIESSVAIQLDQEARELLGLPQPWPGFFRLWADGHTAAEGFSLRLTAHLPSGDEIGPYSVNGPLMFISESEVY